MDTLEIKDIKSDFLHLFSNEETSNNPIRYKALEHIMHISAPNKKDEFWKYTSVNKLLKRKYQLPNKANTTTDNNILSSLPLNEQQSILVFINGIFAKEHSKIVNASVDLIPFSDTIVAEKYTSFYNKLANNQRHFFDAVNTAFHNSGYILGIPSLSDETVQIVHIITDNETVVIPRNLILVDTGAKVTIKEYLVNQATAQNSFVNQLSEIILMSNSRCNYYKYQNLNNNALIDTTYVLQNQDSVYNTHLSSYNTAFVRNNTMIQSSGENTTTTVNGATLTKQNEHIDQHIYIDHQQPNCYSNQLFRTIADDKSTAVFNGKVMVRQDAQKINAFQSNANILLSDFANIYAKPELEIYADDVKCSHGSSTGQLDEDALFYLRARGIKQKTAQKLLITAFLNDTFENVEDEEYVAFIAQEIEQLLQ
jgi:Fe-S cluster assembly protein SufD